MRSFLSIAIVLIFIAIGGLTGRAQTTQATSQPADAAALDAWHKIEDHLSAQSLKDFIAKYPTSEKASDAKLYLELVEKVDAIKSEKSKADFSLPIESLSECWGRWRAGAYCYKSAVVITCRPNGDGLGMPDGFTVRFDDVGKPVLPSKDGSLIILKSMVERPEWNDSADVFFGGVHISSEAKESLYFAIVDKVGFVHLKGACTIKLKDGTTKTLK